MLICVHYVSLKLIICNMFYAASLSSLESANGEYIYLNRTYIDRDLKHASSVTPLCHSCYAVIIVTHNIDSVIR